MVSYQIKFRKTRVFKVHDGIKLSDKFLRMATLRVVILRRYQCAPSAIIHKIIECIVIYFFIFYENPKPTRFPMGYRRTRTPGQILPMQCTFGGRNEFPVAFKTGKNKKKSIARNYDPTIFIALDKLGNSFLIYVGLFLYTQRAYNSLHLRKVQKRIS